MGSDGFDFGIGKWADEHPKRIAIDDGRTPLSYGDMLSKAAGLASGMRRAGVGLGDKVMVSLPNWTEFAVVLLASLRLGAVLVCVNIQCKRIDFERATKLIGQPAMAFVSSEKHAVAVKGVAPGARVKVIGERDRALSSLSDLFEPCAPVQNMCALENDMLIAFTSGSTGGPKGVELTVANFWDPVPCFISRLRLREKDIAFIPAPFCHLLGMYAMLLTFATGGTVLVTRRFDPAKAVSLIERMRVTVQYGVPTMYSRELAVLEREGSVVNVGSLRVGVIAGSPVGEECIDKFEKATGCRLISMYGQTESSGIALGDYGDSECERRNSLMRIRDGVEVRILDDYGAPVPTGSVGEIVVRSKGTMKGYLGDVELTRKVLDERGWLRTGDIGFISSEGRLRVAGRKRDVILRGGYNVFPVELEQVILEGGSVEEVSAVGVPDSDLGESIVVFVKMKKGFDFSEGKMESRLEAELPKYKTPDQIIALRDFPRLESGKIDKKCLVALALSAADKTSC